MVVSTHVLALTVLSAAYLFYGIVTVIYLYFTFAVLIKHSSMQLISTLVALIILGDLCYIIH